MNYIVLTGNASAGETALAVIVAIIGIVIMLAFQIGIVALIVKAVKKRKAAPKKEKPEKVKKEKPKSMKEQLKEQGVTVNTFLPHVNGLPVAEGIMCNVVSYPDRIEFGASGTSIKLEKSKITDICVKTDTEIQQQYVSSVGGAVGGAVLFGPLGAMIGGRAKKKKIKTVDRYLIITYTKDEELKYICFENNNYNGDKLMLEFIQNKPNGNVSISL